MNLLFKKYFGPWILFIVAFSIVISFQNCNNKGFESIKVNSEASQILEVPGPSNNNPQQPFATETFPIPRNPDINLPKCFLWSRYSRIPSKNNNHSSFYQNNPLVWKKSMTDENSTLCNENETYAVLGITHENEGGKSQDINWVGPNFSYIADYFPEDFGTWFTFTEKPLTVGLNTLNQPGKPTPITPSGRNITSGNIGYSLILHSPEIRLSDSKETYVSISLKLNEAIGLATNTKTDYTHYRLALAFNLEWPEQNTTNKNHFFEYNLIITKDYFKLQENGEGCDQINHPSSAHCWNGLGTNTDGVYFDIDNFKPDSPLSFSKIEKPFTKMTPNGKTFTYRIPLNPILKNVNWWRKPSNLNQVTVHPYLVMEVEGQAKISYELVNFKISKANLNDQPSPTTDPLPIGLFRSGPENIGGFISYDKITYCSLKSAAHMFANGKTQSDYDSAPKISYNVLINKQFKGECSWPKSVLVKSSSGSGYIASSTGYCTLSDTQALNSCGYSQSQYDNSPIVADLSNLGEINLGVCKCN